jgi:hypothetical protein
MRSTIAKRSFNDCNKLFSRFGAAGDTHKMNPFLFLTKWFWAVCIAVSFINARMFQARARRHALDNPQLSEGYRAIIKGFVMWGNLPWVVMGIGCVFGGVPSVFDFFRPRDGNPFVLAFFASVILVWVLGTYWLVFRGGAEMLVKHPGLFNVDLKNPKVVKLYWFLCLAGGVAGMILMFSGVIPLAPQ